MLNNGIDVVISGIAGRFPASDSVEEFKQNLYNGVDMVTEDSSRWPVGLWNLPPSNGKVKSFDKFDSDFFGFTPKEVEYIDPQERKLLEVTFEAIVDAGVNPRSLAGTNTGVFQGSCFVEYHKDYKDSAATSKYIPNQVTTLSRYLNLKGPLMHVDTACGSSFCALNEAFRALKNGMCEQAIVTGSNTVFQPIFSYEMLDLHMISKDGKSKCMDESANGYARAEAVVVIFLQKKSMAKRIYATILNSKTNADGWKPEGVTFPGQEGQAKLLRETYDEIGLNPLDFEYIEAHTTGTAAGDPVELNAIHDVLCKDRDDSLLVGCIKSCIGHSEGASGLCALIKSLLVLQNKKIPPNLHLKSPNLNIKGLVDGKMTPVTKITPFRGNTIPVNCFGFGGANVHVVIRSCDRRLEPESFRLVEGFPRLVPFCGRTKDAVNYLFDQVQSNQELRTREFLSLVNDFSKISANEGMPYRSYMIMAPNSSRRQEPQKVDKDIRKLCLYFPNCATDCGQFAENLFEIPLFAQSLKQLDETIKVVGINLFEALEKDPSLRTLKETIAISISVQIAMVDLLKSLNIQADHIAGNSIGEFGCAYYDGSVSAEQALLAAFCAAVFYENGDKLEASLNKLFVDPQKRSSRWTSSGPALASGAFFGEHISQNSDSLETLMANDQPLIIEVGPWGLRERGQTIDSDDGCMATIDCIGRLYMAGHNPAIENIYPQVEYPIPTAVPSLSPLIKWDHERTWSLGTRLIELDKSNNAVLARIIPFHFDKQEHPEDNFLFDHRIDGRILFPATGYLAMAWFALAKLKSVAFQECPVRFSEVSIDRATVLSPSKATSFHVRMNEDTGRFEVKEGDTVVVSGRMQLGDADLDNPIQFKDTDDFEDFQKGITQLSSLDIYKELRVRGYDYEPFFQGMYSARSDGSEATIVWRDALPKNVRDTMSIQTEDEVDLMWLRSWTMFVDSVIQLTLLDEENTGRALFVPTKLEQLECSPKSFRSELTRAPEISDPLTLSQSKLIQCTYNRYDDVIQTRGLVLKGLKTTLLKRNQQIVHSKKFEFIPFNEPSCCETELERNELESYHQECERIARLVTDAQNGNLDHSQLEPVTKFDLNKPRYALLNAMQDFLRKGYLNDQVSLSEDLLVGQSDREQLFSDRLLKPLFDIVTYNTISSPKHNSIDVLEVTDNSSFNLNKKFSYLMDESLFSDQTTISYSILNCGSSNSDSSTPAGVQKVVNWDPLNEAMIPNCHLIVLKALGEPEVLSDIRLLNALYNSTKEGGFLMLVNRDRSPSEDIEVAIETMNLQNQMPKFSPKDRTLQSCLDMGYKLIGTKTILSRILPLSISILRKQRIEMSPNNQITMHVGLSNYQDWLEPLKELLKQEQFEQDRRIWLLPKLDEPEANLRISGLIGFVKTLRLEQGGDRLRCLLDWTQTRTNSKSISLEDPKYRHVLQTDLVFNCLHDLRQGWGSYEHLFINEQVSYRDVLEVQDHLYLKSMKPGDLSSLAWVENNFRQQRPKESLVKVFYAPLNFKDIMYASGKLALDSVKDIDPVVAQDSLLGIEFAGEDYNGQRVIGVLPYKALATTVSLSENSFVLPVPKNWSLEEASTVPVVYSTALYGLMVRGNLRRGESVLIHSGAGGVGMAALNICLWMDCTVYTTVGTEDKIEFLLNQFPKLKRENIFNSRDTRFEEDLARITDGQGVDVVLNSLSGDKLQASLRCVANGGRFIEIGKVDLLSDAALYSWQLEGNRQMHGVYPESFFRFNDHKEFYWPKRMCAERQQLKQLIIDGMANGMVRPLPRTVYPMARVEEAFRFMSSGRHIGKVLIQMRDLQSPPAAVDRSMISRATHFYPNKSYLVIGGLGGFGLEVVQWMAERGAKNIVVNSRRGLREPYHKYCVDRIRKEHGAKVLISQEDSTTETGMLALLNQTSEMGPVGGVLNTAAVFNDMLFDDQTEHTFDMVCAPKVRATLYADKLTRLMCPSLDHFVAFSSISAGRGNPGQTNYNFANSIMDLICERRRQDGLPGLSIQWGVIGDVGYVAEMANSNGTVILGLTSQRMHSCLAHLDRFMNSPNAIVCCYVKAEKKSADDLSDTTDILKLVSRILGLKDINSVDQGTTLGSLGIDSLIAVEIQQIIERVQGTQVPLKQVKELTIGQFVQMTMASEEAKAGAGG